jgi:hypothetical protein
LGGPSIDRAVDVVVETEDRVDRTVLERRVGQDIRGAEPVVGVRLVVVDCVVES